MDRDELRSHPSPGKPTVNIRRKECGANAHAAERSAAALSGVRRCASGEQNQEGGETRAGEPREESSFHAMANRTRGLRRFALGAREEPAQRPAMQRILPFILALFSLALLTPASGAPVTERSVTSGVELQERRVPIGTQEATVHFVRFKPERYTLAVMDNPAGDFTLATAARKRGALAAVNGGYFHPDRTPLGLVVRQGKVLHPVQRAKLLSGMVVVRGARISLFRPAELKSTNGVQEALQAGPFLVDGSNPVPGLNATRTAARTVVFTDNTGQCGLLICRYTTLAETAAILSRPGLLPPPAKITRALNLDGGSSTGMWVRGEPEFHVREGKDVRNYLAVVPRS